MKILFFANTDWYLYHFRLDLARYFQAQGLEVVLMSPPGDYAQCFIDNGFRWLAVPMNRRSLNPFRELGLLKHIAAIYQQEAPDAVLHFTLKPVLYGGLAAQIAGIQHRIHAVTGLGHVFINPSLKARILRPVVQCLLRLALRGKSSRLIVQNPDDQRFFLDRCFLPPEQIHLIRGSGVDTEFFTPEQQQRHEKFRVLLAARLLREKGIKEYAEAAALLAHRANEIEFLLAGAADPGNPSSITKAEMRQWQASGQLNLLGQVENMRQLLSEVDLMVLPSWREGVPRSLLEAASMALPLVATDVPGCREIVEDGRNGFLVPKGNAAALAAKIEYLLDHPELCSQFGKAGREKAVQAFDRSIVCCQTWDVCRALGLGC
ncbi:glycosyltransferase family 4 protein [Candidatus Electronema sp. PJ]|uniref:glycosyltransferase family 4 protein n=1 Tax=Candidatus Electronema sp. PJ TaxID=3401572 RepID=UPI003AA7EC0C